MKKSFLLVKDLQVNDIVGTPRSRKTSFIGETVQKSLLAGKQTLDSSKELEKGLFASLSVKYLRSESVESVQVQNVESVEQKIANMNAIEKEKARLRLIKNAKLVSKLQSTGVKKLGNQQQKSLKRTMTLKNLVQQERKKELIRLEALLSPGKKLISTGTF